MKRVYNFSAGPSMLPLDVLMQAAQEMPDWQNMGCGVMEVSHRSPAYELLLEEIESDFRQLLNIPANYQVLFLQGGAKLQFSSVVMNLLSGGSADYVLTGSWSQMAFAEAQRLAPLLGGTVRLAATTENEFCCLPTFSQYQLDAKAKYVYLCTNETIHGVEFLNERDLPETDVPLVVDMSSNILSKPIDINRYGLIFAGAQKNIGCAGLTIVIVREDLLDKAWAGIPSVMDYAVMAKHRSMYNTPPTYAIYITGLVLQWLKKQGGLAVMAQRNQQKAQLLYDYIDQTDFYTNSVECRARSRMNVPFFLQNEQLNTLFLQQAADANMVHLKGHKSLGGMRASIYNAMPIQGVQLLVQFMQDFSVRYG